MKIIIGITFLIIALSSSLSALPWVTKKDDADDNMPPDYFDIMNMKRPKMRTPFTGTNSDAGTSIESVAGTKMVSEQSLRAMDFDKLIQSATPQNVQIIGDILKSKFQINEKRVLIVNGDDPYSLDDEDSIIIGNLDLANQLIEHFSNTFDKLDFEGATFTDSSKSKQTLQLINEKCANSLVDVELLPSDWTASLTKPFESVKKALVMGTVSERLDLNALYPNMQELRLKNVKSSSNSFVIQKFSNLKNISYYFGRGDDPMILSLLRLNPQIESFEPRERLPCSFIEDVNKILPNLNTFYIIFNAKFLCTKPIRFENVENFIMYDRCEEMTSFPFIFPKLKTLTYNQYGKKGPFDNDWLTTIPNAQNLVKLSMPKTTLTVQEIMDLSKRFPNVKAISFRFMPHFIQSHMSDLIEMLFDTDLDRIDIYHMPLTFRDTLIVNLSTAIWTYESKFEKPYNGLVILSLKKKTI